MLREPYMTVSLASRMSLSSSYCADCMHGDKYGGMPPVLAAWSVLLPTSLEVW